MLLGILLAILIVVVTAMVGVILLQRSEGGALGMGGGGPGAFMTARGAGDLLTRSTQILATVFFVLCLLMNLIIGHNHANRSIVDRVNMSSLLSGAPPAPASSAPAGNPFLAPPPAPTAPAPAGAPATAPFGGAGPLAGPGLASAPAPAHAAAKASAKPAKAQPQPAASAAPSAPDINPAPLNVPPPPSAPPATPGTAGAPIAGQ